jgi:hypothetical protein
MITSVPFSRIFSVIKWSSVKIYVWSAFFHFRQYFYPTFLHSCPFRRSAEHILLRAISLVGKIFGTFLACSSLWITSVPFSLIFSVIKWSSVKIYVWSAFFHFKQYSYHVTRFVIFKEIFALKGLVSK